MQFLLGVVVAPSVPACNNTIAVRLKDCHLVNGGFLFTDGRVGHKVSVTLIGPVACCVGFDNFPLQIIQSGFFCYFQLFFSSKVVADVAVVNATRSCVAGVLNGDQDGDGVPAAGAEDLAPFLAG